MAKALQVSCFFSAPFLGNTNSESCSIGFLPPPNSNSSFRSLKIRAIKDKTHQINNPSPEEITNKYGLEAGLWKIFSSKEENEENEEKKKSKGEQAKELLAKYGGAYLATSISLSLISFSLCYALISAGIDVQALLQKVGISVDATGEKVGTFALAYAAHKAASPIRFPPTVVLTPIVAGWIGKKVDQPNPVLAIAVSSQDVAVLEAFRAIQSSICQTNLRDAGDCRATMPCHLQPH